MTIFRIILLLCLLGFQGSEQPALVHCQRLETLQSCLRNFSGQIGSRSARLDTFLRVKSQDEYSYIATYIIDDEDAGERIVAVAIDSIRQSTYSARLLDTFDFLPAKPEMLCAFTANADPDKADELIALVGWHTDDINFRGYTYQVYVYDLPGNITDRIVFKENSLKIFPRESRATRQAERLDAKYNTEAKIRRRLRELGYKQYSK